MKRKKKPSRLAKVLLKTAEGMQKSGLLGRATYDKIAQRHRGSKGTPKEARLSGATTRALRQRSA